VQGSILRLRSVTDPAGGRQRDSSASRRTTAALAFRGSRTSDFERYVDRPVRKDR
jgi:hypothetical protein